MEDDSAPPSESLAFLVVEDVVVVRDALVRALSPFGHVEAVGSLAVGRQALSQRRFDSLIVDVGLPDGSGFDLVVPARQKWPGIWVLVLTGLSEHAVVARAHELGVRYLLKPFDTDQLKVHVEETRARSSASATPSPPTRSASPSPSTAGPEPTP